MRPQSLTSLIVLAVLVMLGGCATRPINPPIEQVDLSKGYRFDTRWAHRSNYDAENLVVLAFSGGGTRAAAFSYGVLETLRDMEVIGPKGRKFRMLDEVDLVTGVSGGSFTALAYGLYGDKLFDLYETSFLKRDVQGTLITRALNPGNWGALSSETGAARNWPRLFMTRFCSMAPPSLIWIAERDPKYSRAPPTSRPAPDWASPNTPSTTYART